ncbi:MAG: hypothetical protein Q7U14_15360, partial [Lacisediminimonas sp.]|nr:hypothetical protein [Lacisediminimonas sp.]
PRTVRNVANAVHNPPILPVPSRCVAPSRTGFPQCSRMRRHGWRGAEESASQTNKNSDIVRRLTNFDGQ